MYQLILNEFSKKLNENFRRNGGQEEIRYSMNRDMERMLSVTSESYSPGQNLTKPVDKMGKGMRSVYMLSLLETYAEGSGQNQGIVVVEERLKYLFDNFDTEYVEKIAFRNAEELLLIK
ncbi:MAG: hypothetical protein SOY12_09740 [Schaedlerella sp.]|nr:hypothetical protein [Lachnospiraceae bacterium]MDY4203297.1 hypothetical protein [Schaedlerella sp.]